ncbi:MULTISPECIES: HlyD family type I secretion periplasmic adaptor subunit [unclassified Shewanella]|uniref:HlyD family type I secretion periplasmic adaptor subunit n=1 Tax=unclassified Shewanella TaxID=196818 RepID=UPI001BBD176F|nr:MULTISPECIES: HlyD family type I secretion periplasmic adaptor subunit [unclassified Shewanella]GIU20785.1 HlyD family type I secretion periplasmic adaptor subunit [Shewanella sp. MBTL60-112-B1]GIU30004.1 HlyD family type I secretion periplasmic adaptor subunit [Shewanella sp. MBTL60-112-B2]
MSGRLHIKHLEGAKRANQLILLVAALIVVTLVWASFAKLEEVVVGEGMVVPTLAVQQIESLDGGILKQVLVKEGQSVTAGEPLLLLDELRFASAFDEANIQAAALKRQKARLDAEITSVVIADNADYWRDKVLITPKAISALDVAVSTRSKAIFRSRLSQLSSQLEQSAQVIEQKVQAIEEAQITTQAQLSGLELVKQEIVMTRAAVREGAVAELEVLKLERDEIRLKGELSASKANGRQLRAAQNQAEAEYLTVALDFLSRAEAERNEVINELNALTESIKTLADRLARTKIVSPIKGNVTNILVRSIGAVVEPGESIMGIVPQDGALIIETRIAPKDIAFVHTGLQATVKFTAYDFVIYGGLKGEVIYVSPDAQQLDDGTTYFEAHIKTEENILNGWPIISGMQASTDILTGEKTVLNYWLKPLLRAKANALREQ